MRITEARPRDALALHALHREVLAEEDWFITLPDELVGDASDRERLLVAYGESLNSVVLVARLDHGVVAGMVTVVGGSLSRMRHTGRVELMVARAHRGRGVGRLLLEAAVAWARANPVLEKIGLSVFADNTRAVTLYRTVGFEVEGTRKREYRLADGSYRDDLLMYLMVG